MVEQQPSKLNMRVRFPLPAPVIVKHLISNQTVVFKCLSLQVDYVV